MPHGMHPRHPRKRTSSVTGIGRVAHHFQTIIVSARAVGTSKKKNMLCFYIPPAYRRTPLKRGRATRDYIVNQMYTDYYITAHPLMRGEQTSSECLPKW